MSRCQPCANLSVLYLVDLALKEFASGAFSGFPKVNFYEHHTSFDELEESAQFGCDLCRLIMDLSKCYNATDWDLDWEPGTCDIDMSMYGTAKAIKVSNVRMALASSYYHKLAPERVKEPRILDSLLVQVGPTGDELSEGEWAIPLLLLKLSVPHNTPLYLRGVQIGRFQTDADLGCTENFDLARHWLKVCHEDHKSCLSGDLPLLPTRVVDVGVKNDMKALRVIHSQGAKGEYTALSHCWGGEITTLLTTTTLAAFGTSLPYEALPANFRDAITITRELDIQYLWIDSLCILQDSPQDWANESEKMGDVYGNSTLTISATASSGSTSGILLQHSDGSPDTPRPTTLEVRTEDGSSVAMTVEWEGWDEESLSTLENYSPLSTRGWTLQEAVLSPRRLFYGKNRIYWRCPSAMKSAATRCDLTEGPNTPDRYFPCVSLIVQSAVLSSRAQSNRPQRSLVLEDYYLLVRTYSSRTLTFPSDKLPAFSGLAQRLHHVAGGDYLAGLWSSDIKRGLLWMGETGYCWHLTQPYRAPSWSWAVTDNLVLFDYQEDFPGATNPFHMRLLEYSITPKDAKNPFGQVTGGHLVVEGLVMKLVRTKQIMPFRLLDDPSIGQGTFDEPWVDGTVEELREKGYFSLTPLYQIQNASGADRILSISQSAQWPVVDEDAFDVLTDEFLEEECIALLVKHLPAEADVDEDGEEEFRSAAGCLALRLVAGLSGNVYERIGKLDLRGFADEWLQSWENRRLTLI